jgi:biopolymer transport protein ExbD
MASSSIKRQRKRKRVDTDGDPELQVAPMVDVLLVLMLFFMLITSTEVLTKDQKLTLASAKDAKKNTSPNKDKIVINVEWLPEKQMAQYYLDQTAYTSASDLTPILGGREKDNPNAYVIVRADKNVQFSFISDLMNACKDANIAVINFAVITGGAHAQTPPPEAQP